MNTSNGSVIHTQDLGKTYKGVNALQGLNLQVPKNSIYGFLGPNGAGKSTTIKMLLGLTRPTSGKALVFGKDITQESLAIRRKVGYLAQDPRYYEHMTARQTLRYTARFFYSGPRDLLEARIEEMLELVGLDDKADRPIRGFSGGERQRLGIAQAQINYPDLLILDEPAAALDPQGRRDVLTVMESLRKHTTIFYSTHILDDVQRVSDRVAILNRGGLVAEAPIQELLNGNGSSILYDVTIRGDVSRAQARVANQPWVRSLNVEANHGAVNWQVGVSDEAAAEDQMLRLILEDRNVSVKHFGRKTHNLEEIFLSMVGEEKSK
ncbi:MAG: putative ABC transporter ATP-binding protein YxlF [Anaerolineales bacterium]|nr:putative ABC transporter ATP-binding protein YxlF [Anaerolineales bacterium]WKZ47060.1 MAG: ABC transporter ATP-binding protein [Anaerolineales bacterium]